MAAVLKLIQRDDFTSDIVTLNLLAFASGYDLEWAGWTPKVTDGSSKDIQETIPLIVRGTTLDAMSDALNLLDDMIRYKKQYSSSVEKYGVWLQVQLDGEPAARQVFLPELTYTLTGNPYDGAAADGYYYQQLTLIATRKPLWEAIASTDYALTAIYCIGGTFDYTTYGGSPGAVTGTDPARLALTSFKGYSGGETGALYKFWAGFRTERYGVRANFIPFWSLRKSCLFDADTTGGTTNADATAKDGYKTITTFSAVPTLLRRLTIRTQDVTANYNDQRGKFTVVLRAKNSAAGTVRVRLADGLMPTVAGPMSGNVQGRVPIASTSWQFYELGSVEIPSPGRMVAGSNLMINYALGIDAERVSGSCNLEMDCVVMIPCGEGFVYADGGIVQYAAGDTKPLYVQNRADDTKDSVAMSGNYPVALGTPNVSDGLPIGNGIVVVCGQQASVSVLADAIDMDIKVYRRWRSLRGVA